MDIKAVKYELQNLISGKSGTSHDAAIQAIAQYLRSGQKAGPMAEEKHQNKLQEAIRLTQFAKDQQIWINEIQQENFISQGAEQKVYISGDKHVLKLNDGIYYASWEDYFHNLLLHNYFFADTAYEMVGFCELDGQLHTIVKQPYVKADSLTELQNVKAFMETNGFKNTRGHDYHHSLLGIIIEDLHDENVLSNAGLLYFIDTVFYIVPEEFWS